MVPVFRPANDDLLEPLADKWLAFGWHVAEIDGHDHREILDALAAAGRVAGKPCVIIAHTIKGCGVPWMENIPQWHGSVKLTREQAASALSALGASETQITDWLDNG